MEARALDGDLRRERERALRAYLEAARRRRKRIAESVGVRMRKTFPTCMAVSVPNLLSLPFPGNGRHVAEHSSGARHGALPVAAPPCRASFSPTAAMRRDARRAERANLAGPAGQKHLHDLWCPVSYKSLKNPL